jgi:hypothetical protein
MAGSNVENLNENKSRRGSIPPINVSTETYNSKKGSKQTNRIRRE